MNLVSLSARNALRNPVRTGLTVLGVAIAVLTFVLLRTVIWAYGAGVEAAAKDRVVTRHKVTFTMQLPKRYVDTVKEQPGVTQATWANWFGGKDPKNETEFFSTLAVDAKTYLDVYDEMLVTPEEKTAFLADRQGALVGDAIAKKLGWKKGDEIVLQSQFIPGDFRFRIHGVYQAARKSVDRSTVMFHWEVMNEAVPTLNRDQVGWIVSRVKEPSGSASLAVGIDKIFDEKDVQTLSQDEGTFNASFLGMFGAILKALDLVSVVILGIMALILGNTIAMGVRERTQEYGTLRALGFLPRHLAVFVLGESVTVGVAGGAVGLVLGYGLINLVLGRWIEENIGAFFPYFMVTPGVAALAFGLALLLGALAAAIPAYLAANLKVVDALRRVA
jgi:putative ABC transport system permease protein